jgi:hypothetical protein
MAEYHGLFWIFGGPFIATAASLKENEWLATLFGPLQLFVASWTST